MQKSLILLFTLSCLYAPLAQGYEEVKIRKTMKEFNDSLRIVIPKTLAIEDFSNKKNAGEISTQLKKMQGFAQKLKPSIWQGDERKEYFSTLLIKDTEQAVDFFDKKKYGQTKYLLYRITETCTSCHSQKNNKGFQFVFTKFKNFTEEEKKKMGRFELPHFYSAFRKYSDAATEYEKTFSTSAKILDSRFVNEYIKIVFLNLNDPMRFKTFINKYIAKHKAALDKLSMNILLKWQQTAASIEKSPEKMKDLGSKISWVYKRLEKHTNFPIKIENAVEFAYLSSLINKRMSQKSKIGPRLKSMYYFFLGTSEEVLSHSFLMSHSDFFWKQSIKTDMGGMWAQKSYNMMKEYTVNGYTGSGGTRIPGKVQEMLNEYKKYAYPGKKGDKSSKANKTGKAAKSKDLSN